MSKIMTSSLKPLSTYDHFEEIRNLNMTIHLNACKNILMIFFKNKSYNYDQISKIRIFTIKCRIF